MQARLICYSLKNLTSAERVAFRRSIYGFNDHSNKSKYSYRRQGVMDSVEHKKILDSVMIVKNSDADKVVKRMKACKATVYVFPVVIPFKL